MLIITIIILLTGASKIGYHHANFLSSKVPESCILVILGTIFGVIIMYGLDKEKETQDLIHEIDLSSPHIFFFLLLPPIILEAAFSLHDRTFVENIGSILLFAVVGTVLVCFMLGITLFGLYKAGGFDLGDKTLSFTQIMIFSSLISAVDPVAVLAVFDEIGVNHVLYFLIFGESLLNDGVSVVLYKVFIAYNEMDEIFPGHYFLGFLKFLVVSVGGVAIGVLTGFATAFLTKFSTRVEVAQPLIVYTIAYLGFLIAELFEFSGIICIICTGLVQVHYAFANISDKSRTAIKYFTKVIATCSEIIIFLFLGIELVKEDIYVDWSTGFAVWTIILCLIFRFVIVFGITYVINRATGTVGKIERKDMFMISYGGLRGAVCFSLVRLLEEDEENPDVMSKQVKNMFTTTTLAVIMFTVFVQGSTIKPLVDFFHIKLAQQTNPSVFLELCEHLNDNLIAGVEDIIGCHGMNHFRQLFEHYDNKYLKKYLQVIPRPRGVSLQSVYENLLVEEHLSHPKQREYGVPEISELPVISCDVPQQSSDKRLNQSLDQEGPTDGVEALDVECDNRLPSSPRDHHHMSLKDMLSGTRAKHATKKYNKNITRAMSCPEEHSNSNVRLWQISKTTFDRQDTEL